MGVRKGEKVTWKWGKGKAEGKVAETSSATMTKTIDGHEVKRNGSEDNKALLIEQEDGQRVVKLESELD